MISELESHYQRLDRLGRSDLWAWLFGGLAEVFLGAAVGAALAKEDVVNWLVIVLALFAVFSAVAFLAVRDTPRQSR